MTNFYTNEEIKNLKEVCEKMDITMIDNDRWGMGFDPFGHGWLHEYEDTMQLEAPSDTYILEMEVQNA